MCKLHAFRSAFIAPDDAETKATELARPLPAVRKVGFTRRKVQGMGGRLRSELSRRKDQFLSLLGIPDRGFFIQYRYSNRVPEIAEPYREVEALFRACEPRFRETLAEMGADLEAFSGPNALNEGLDWHSSMFPPLDGAACYTLAKSSGAETIVEIGSGDSTRFLELAIKDSGRDTRLVCIDPAPRRTLNGLDVEWRHRVLGMEDIPLFEEMKANDILFIDSSHIMLPDMDVDILFNRIFPKLSPGVIVHVHDIFLPDP